MNILYLGPENKNLIDILKTDKDEIISINKKLLEDDYLFHWAEIILIYSYRFIISEEIIKKFKRRIINMHISYLPWNRGADPHLWSIIEDTPKGVSIHYVDSGIDTGPIIAQSLVHISLNDSLKDGYEKLQKEIQSLLIKKWDLIKKEEIKSIKQKDLGTFHFLSDAKEFKSNLEQGWDTTGKKLIELYSDFIRKNNV